MKKKDIFTLLQAIENLNAVKGSVNFTYALNKNKRILQDAGRLVQESLKKVEDEETQTLLKEFDNNQLKIAKEFETDADGTVQIFINNTVIRILPSSVEAMSHKLNELATDAKYKEVLEKSQVLKKENEVLLESDVDEDFKLHKIKLEELPELTVAEQDAIFDLIEE